MAAAPHARTVTIHRLVDGQPPEIREAWPVDARELMAQGWVAGMPAETVAPEPATDSKLAWYTDQLMEKSKKDLVALAEKLGVATVGNKEALTAAILPHALAGTLSLEDVKLFVAPEAGGFTPVS